MTSPARKLQRLVEDEYGKAPALQMCHNLLAVTPNEKRLTLQEFLAKLYLENKEKLHGSADMREAKKAKR